MTVRKLAKPLVMVTVLLVGMSGGVEAALDQIIGLSTNDQGSALVKRFRVPAGTVIVGVEVKSNDDRTVFPGIAILRGPATKLSDATKLVEVPNVASTSRHRTRPTFAPIAVETEQEILVSVSWPISPGVHGVGEGAGVGATGLEEPADCFISTNPNEPLQLLAADLAITLLTESAGKANVSEPGLEPKTGLETFLGKPVLGSGGAIEIEFELAVGGPARLEIYDVTGRRIRTIVQAELRAGHYERTWNGESDQGQPVAAGLYFAKLVAGNHELTKKLMLLR